ncbi:MAG: helix-turn-helix domain-containing protein [Streptosporangiales bacterium]|nr:helix-turn-helix domain-containing protein [Streptosporangiales bacterium]
MAGWIRQRRLEACRQDLADPALAYRSVAAIAARRGFTSAAHFSRVFKAAHGAKARNDPAPTRPRFDSPPRVAVYERDIS